MKKRLVAVASAAVLALGLFGMFGCSSTEDTSTDTSADATVEATVPSGDISVYTREDGSGTRGAFTELVGIVQDDVDMTSVAAVVTNSTSVMMTSVSSDENAIGYISLGSLNDTVKAVSVYGVEATAENVASGAYSVARPFNIVTMGDVSDVTADFIDFIMSADGQAIVEEEGCVAVSDAGAYEGGDMSGEIIISGSSSVTPVMEKLVEAYEALNPDVSIELNTSDSTTGVNMTVEGTADIGMASREIKDSELESGVDATVIAQDGIAVIVNTASSVDSLTTEQVMQIFTAEVTTWEDVLA